jgi:hypothetical protein
LHTIRPGWLCLTSAEGKSPGRAIAGAFVFWSVDMRDDMCKVIVERPRRGGGRDGARSFRNSEDRPARIGMRVGYGNRKWLNENLAPLKRWLGRQVHRPWDKVYAELTEGIDRRNTVQDHIYAHLDDFVERNARLIEGQVCIGPRWGRGAWTPVEQTRTQLFVHPSTGILLPNRGAARTARRQKEAHAARRLDRPYAKYHIIDAATQWHQFDECWFEVRLQPLPAGRGPSVERYDVLRQCCVGLAHAYQAAPGGKPSNCSMYGRPDVYAASKRQLGRRELARRR